MTSRRDQPAAKTGVVDASLPALFSRLESLSRDPKFRLQRDRAIEWALHPYADYARRLLLFPLPEEMALAQLYLFADYSPDDGQFSLIEQVRDTIEVHVPEEERAWLDPLKRSHMDLLEVVTIKEPAGHEPTLDLRSLGSGQLVHGVRWTQIENLKSGQVLLTRLIHLPDQVLLPGTAILLSTEYAGAILDSTNQWRREAEAQSGSFELGEWGNFAKPYGYVLLWMFAQARMQALLAADARMVYRTTTSRPFLYAVALYEHREYARLAETLNHVEGVQSESQSLGGEASDQPTLVWVQREVSSNETRADIVARVTVTSLLLIAECDSPERLNTLKHLLASSFGFSLHFMGETIAKPTHDLPEPDLSMEAEPHHETIVSVEEEQRLLTRFLESIYLDWPDRPSPSLGGVTPRHAAASSATTVKVAGLIDQLARDDVAQRRTGKPGYDYNLLRRHVGLGR